MALQFLLGGPGCGQTECLYEELVEKSRSNPEQTIFLVVPEQFTMQTQRRLTALHPGGSVIGIEIVGFLRLANRIFDELFISLPDIIDDSGKSMILRKVLEDVREELTVYRTKIEYAGFVSQMKSLVSEFEQYGIGMDGIGEMIIAAERKPLLREKLHDAGVIFSAFKRELEERFLTSEELLDRFCAVVPESRLLRESVVVFDGFSGTPFTPVQFRVIGELLKVCPEVIITGCIAKEDWEKGRINEQSLFYKGSEAIKTIKDMAEKAGVAVKEERLFERQKNETADLDFLERRFYRYHSDTFPYEPEHIHFYSAKNPKEEAEAAVRVIESLVKSGLHYRDIAVITGDLGNYGRHLSYECRECSIPFFLDAKHDLFDNAIVDCLRSALEMVRQNFSYESVFRFVKTGCCHVEREEQDLWENYVLRVGIRGAAAYRNEWNWVPGGWRDEEVSVVNRTKDTAVGPVLRLYEAMKGRFAVREGVLAVRTFMDEMELEHHTEELISIFEARNDQVRMREYRQIYAAVEAILMQMEELLGDVLVESSEFSDILDAGITEKKVSVIPPSVDQVVIGSMDRSRVGDIKVLLFLGLNEGIVPKTMNAGGIFTEGDREFLLQAKIRLAPTAREQSMEDRFRIYHFLTMPSNELYLFYARTGEDGKALAKSIVVNEIRKLFPMGKVEAAEDLQGLPATRKKGRSCLSVSLRELCASGEEPDETVDGLLSLLYEEEPSQACVLLDGAFYAFEPGNADVAELQKLYEAIWKPSVTQLERYGECAYRYFLEGGLHLSERKEHRVEEAELGTLFHDALEYYGKKMMEGEYHWETVTDEERHSLVKEAVGAAAQKAKINGLSKEMENARSQYLLVRVERMTERAVWALGEQIRQSDFKPSHLEYQVKRGRIDRIDTFVDDDHVYVTIIDYKSGKKVFTLEDFYSGLQLQLVLYMKEAVESMQRQEGDKTVVPAGFFYFPIRDDYRCLESSAQMGEESEETAKQANLKEMRMSGYVSSSPEVIGHLDRTLKSGNSFSGKSSTIPVEFTKSGLGKRSQVLTKEEFDTFLTFAQFRADMTRTEIWNGVIAAKPLNRGNRTACDYCPYQAVCGFDPKLKGASYRYPTKKSKEILLEEMKCQVQAETEEK